MNHSSRLETAAPKTLRNLLKTVIAASTIFGCAQPQTTPTKTPDQGIPTQEMVAAPIQVNPTIERRVRSAAMDNEGLKIYEITVVGKRPWPGVPRECAFTGVVLEHDQQSMPHRVLLENMCIQKRDELENVFEGEHRWVSADEAGHYSIPFFNSHLEEENGQLYFVTSDQMGNIFKHPLTPGRYEAGTLSFEPCLEAYQIQNIE